MGECDDLVVFRLQRLLYFTLAYSSSNLGLDLSRFPAIRLYTTPEISID